MEGKFIPYSDRVYPIFERLISYLFIVYELELIYMNSSRDSEVIAKKSRNFFLIFSEKYKVIFVFIS